MTEHNRPTLPETPRGAFFQFPIFLVASLFSLAVMIGSTLYDGNAGLWIGLFGFTFFLVTTAGIVRFDLRHPLVWFNLLFWLYSASTPILHLAGHNFRTITHIASYRDALILEFAAILTFSWAVGLKTISYAETTAPTKYLKFLSRSALPFLGASLVLTWLYLYAFFREGVTSKFAISTSASFFLRWDFAYVFLTVGFSVYFIQWITRRPSLPYKLIAVMGGYFVLTFLVSGERDLVFRFVFVYVLLHTTFYKPVSFRTLAVVFVAGIVGSTLMGSLKNVLLSSDIESATAAFQSFWSEDFVLMLFGSEFRSASENLTMLIEAVPSQVPFFEGKGILGDIISILNIGFLTNRESKLMSPGFWFTNYFFRGYFRQGGGVGFTLVGLGYLDYGMVGVILLFGALGKFVRLLYNHSRDNLLTAIFYFNIVPTIAYSIRASAASILSPAVKHILLPLVLMYVSGVILYKVSQRHTPEPVSSDADRSTVHP